MTQSFKNLSVIEFWSELEPDKPQPCTCTDTCCDRYCRTISHHTDPMELPSGDWICLSCGGTTRED